MGKSPRFKSAAEVQDAVRVFLQRAPLYQGFSYSAPHEQGLSPFPASMSYDCPACRKETTWDAIREEGMKGPVQLFHLCFRCHLCRNQHITFAVNFEFGGGNFALRKVGQFPAWSIAVPAAVERALPANAQPFYKKGLICLSQHFGLAAVAYFRRTVEEVVDLLLKLVEQAATLDPTNRDEAALVALVDARRSHQASDRLKLIAPHLPLHLRVGGANPLARLYEKYSAGLHSLTDEDSIEVAIEMRAILDYVLPALTDQLAAARAYTAAITMSAHRLVQPEVAVSEATVEHVASESSTEASGELAIG